MGTVKTSWGDLFRGSVTAGLASVTRRLPFFAFQLLYYSLTTNHGIPCIPSSARYRQVSCHVALSAINFAGLAEATILKKSSL